MANKKHVAELIKEQGSNQVPTLAWNAWRKEHTDIVPDLSKADLGEVDLIRANLSEANLTGANLMRANLGEANLSGADLSWAMLIGAYLGEADLRGAYLEKADLEKADLIRANLGEANLTRANLMRANLSRANLTGANLNEANLSGAGLFRANLSGADLRGAYLSEANLTEANLSGANLSDADLRGASLVRTRLSATTITGAKVYGISVWDIETDGETKQTGLIITPHDQSVIMVDYLDVAQFIYLLLDREKIRNVINTVTRRGVLVLGRFEDGGLALLQAIAAWLRTPENGGYLPLLFDFPRPESKTYTDTVRTLASLARFVIVDLSGPSVPQEITATVDLYEIPFVPILEQNRKDWSMFRDFLTKERVLKPVRFTDQNQLLQLLAKQVIAPAEKLIEKRQQRLDEIFGSA